MAWRRRGDKLLSDLMMISVLTHICVTRPQWVKIFIRFVTEFRRCICTAKPPHIMTSSNGNIFRITGPLCGEFTGHRWIPLTKASDAEVWGFLDLRLKKRLSKQSRLQWFATPSRSLWRHRNYNWLRWIIIGYMAPGHYRHLYCRTLIWSHRNMEMMYYFSNVETTNMTPDKGCNI